MKKIIYIILILVLGGVIFWIFKTKTPPEEPITPVVIQKDVKQSVEAYMRAHISELSPVKAVLGGTWYVVSVDTDLSTKSGTVIYEDGHIQEKRTFTYTVDTQGEVVNLKIK